MDGIFSGEEGMKHCKDCDSPELFEGEINKYGYCFGCSDGDENYGKPQPSGDATLPQNDPRSPYWLRSGRHG